MTDHADRDTTAGTTADDTPRPRVLVIEGEPEVRDDAPAAPRVIMTTEGGRIVAAAPAPAEPQTAIVAAEPPRPGRRVMRFGALGIATAFAGWLGIDAYLWIASVFEHSIALGWTATAAVGAGVAGAGAMIAHELRSFLALKSVEANQRRIAADLVTAHAGDARDTIRSVLAVIPKDRDSRNAIAVFQRKVQRHHTAAQQLELLSQTVMTPLDRRAEAIVRRTSARAFGVTAVSPTAVTDALFFLALSVRMVREIATCYGHRPTTAATIHLLRRLIVEAGRLGAIDLAAATLTQHITGAVAERLAASAAESVYATQRMARLGLVTMELCRPVPFRRQEIPGIMRSLVGNLLAKSPRGGDQDGPPP